MLEFLFVPTILFLVIVAPLWIAMHYNNARKSSGSLDHQDREVFEQLLADLDKMTERIETLESILDNDSPDWRKRASSSPPNPANEARS